MINAVDGYLCKNAKILKVYGLYYQQRDAGVDKSVCVISNLPGDFSLSRKLNAQSMAINFP